MADYDQIMTALRAAHAAGDTAAASRLAQMANEAKAQKLGFPATPQGGSSADPVAVDQFQRKGRAALIGAADGMSLGFADEMDGALSGVMSAVQGNGYSDAYAARRDLVRQGMADTQAEEPTAYGGGQVLGGVATAGVTAPYATGATLGTTMGRGAVIGGIEGGLYGFGSGEGVQDRMAGAAKGAAIGAGIGVAAPAVVRGGVMAKNMVMDPASALLNTGNATKANRALMETMQSGKTTPQKIAQMMQEAAQQGQPEFRLMDAMGTAGQRRASGVTRAGGDAANDISDFLTSRQAGQADRVGGFVDDAFGTTGTTAAKTTEALKQARGATANAAYDAARGNAAPVDIRGALGVIDARIGGMQGSGVAGDGIDGKLAGYRSRLAAQPGPDGVSRELSDFDRVLSVKQSIQDDIGAAVRAGRNNEARELGKLASELDSALEGSSDMYRSANDGFRDASKTIDAVGQGADMAKRGRAADNVPAFQGMNPDQQGAARVGYGDDMLRRIEANTAPTANKAKILQSPKRDAEAGAMALDPNLYGQRLSRENTMWETQNRALGGSKTADNLQDISQTGEAAAGALDVARSAGNLQLGDVVAKAGAMLGPMIKGQNEATRQLIAKALMSDDPAKALAPMLKQQAGSDSKRRMIEALIRNAGRDPATKAVWPQ